MKDPYLNPILGLLATGLTCSAFSISGWLHGTELLKFGGIEIRYPAAHRKLPLSVMGFGFCFSAWYLTQDRKQWQRQYRLWERRQQQMEFQRHAIAAQADLQGYTQLAQLQAAERLYPEMQPYLDAQYEELPQQAAGQVSAPGQPAAPASSLPIQDSTPATGVPTDQSVSGQCAIGIRDLTAEIARYDGHVLIASRTRSGKTTTIQSAIRHTHSRYNGRIEFHVFDPKGASWCGLEKSKNYLFCNKPEYIPSALTRLERLITHMQQRQETRMQLGGHYTPGNEPTPIIVAIDEFNTLQSLAKEYDESFPPKENPRTQSKIQRYVERLIFQGAEDRVYVWLMAQTTRVQLLGLDTSVQDNMAYFAQSRNGDYQSVEDAISNNYVVSNPTQRKELQGLLTSYRYDRSQDLKIPIAFTTLGGNQLCKLPDLSQAKHYQIPSTAMQEEPPYPSSHRSPHPPINQREQFLFQARNWLEDCLQEPGSELPEPLQRIVERSKRIGWVNVSDLRQNDRYFKAKNLDGSYQLSPNQIRNFFYQLINRGLGRIDGEGTSLRWCLDADRPLDNEGV